MSNYGMSAESMYGMTVEEAQETAQAEITTISNTQDQQRLQKLINEKNKVTKPISNLVKMITKKTVRVESGFITKEKQFIYKDGKIVPKDTPYHIHYTSDLREYFMTENEHTPTSRVIDKIDSPTDFTLYQTMKKQTPMLLKEYVSKPTKKDLRAGYYKRYFAKKANEAISPFEIKKSDYNKSPLYEYTTVIWHFLGSMEGVNDVNNLALELAEKRLQGMKKAIPNLQFFIATPANSSAKEIVESKLSKMVSSVSTESGGGQTTTSQTQQSPAPSGYNAGSGGPPPGVMTGGAGGGGSY